MPSCFLDTVWHDFLYMMWSTRKNMAFERKHKISFLAGVIALTVGIHYGFVLEPIFGHTGWVHAIHGRFCYIPIAVAAVWFGLRGSLTVATVISVVVLPYVLSSGKHGSGLSGEIVEIIFYYAIALLTGALIDRELLIRKKQEQTQLQLERTHKLSMVGQLAAGVAHEIKNPLASIKGAVEILVDESTPAEDKSEFKDIVVKEIKRVDGTIGEFLDFARPKEIEFKKIDMVSLVNAAARQLEAQLEKMNLRIRTDLEDNIFISGDYQKIHQVLLNLILNAADASDHNDVINVNLKKQGAKEICLCVSDKGSGIDNLNIEKVFDPFYTTKSTGTGLGLAVVKSIIEKHNGSIEINSRRDKGTEMKIILPAYGGLS